MNCGLKIGLVPVLVFAVFGAPSIAAQESLGELSCRSDYPLLGTGETRLRTSSGSAIRVSARGLFRRDAA